MSKNVLYTPYIRYTVSPAFNTVPKFTLSDVKWLGLRGLALQQPCEVLEARALAPRLPADSFLLFDWLICVVSKTHAFFLLVNRVYACVDNKESIFAIIYR